MITTPTDLQLKLALAKELPELIDICWRTPSTCRIPTDKLQVGDFHFTWIKDNEKVTPREWDWVMNQVYLLNIKGRLTCSYAMHLDELLEQSSMPAWKHEATWQQRAIAYFKVKGIII